MSRRLNHVISFRVSAAEAMRLQQLRETFTDQQWAEVMRWLLTQPEVNTLIDERISEHPVDVSFL